MTAVTLFDVVEDLDSSGPPASVGSRHGLAGFAAALVRAAREDYQRLRRYERDFASLPDDDDDPAELKVLRCVWRLFDQWAEQAEQVLARVERLEKSGVPISDADGLRDDYGFTRARLSITPEQILHAKQQAVRGEGIPLKELRDELRARLHA